ncbi:MAG: aminotransferase [Parvibaculaceae bacterium]|nr:aminotransferase [Parvibaculaceae bacterium]
MTEVALFQRSDLPCPDISETQAAEILARCYGVTGSVRELGSQQDRNFLVETGDARYVLKICHADYSEAELTAQNAAMAHLRARKGAPGTPAVMADRDGRELVSLTVEGQALQVRLLDFLDGTSLTHLGYMPPDLVARFGRLCAELALALEDFEHPGLFRPLQWDLRRADSVIGHMLPAVENERDRVRILAVVEEAHRRIEPWIPAFRAQAVHHDVTDDNVVCRRDERGHWRPEGVIDFGDLVHGWRVADLAVTCASLLHHAEGDPFAILPAVAAYHAINPLNEAELRALWPLVVVRGAVQWVCGEHQNKVDTGNDYAAGNLDHERKIFEVATSVPFGLMEAAILESAGLGKAFSVAEASAPLLPGVKAEEFRFADLGVLGAGFREGNWGEPGIDQRLLEEAAAATGLAATRHGEYRLSQTKTDSPHEPETCALHVDLVLPSGTLVQAPFGGVLRHETGGAAVLDGPGLSLWLWGLEGVHSAVTVDRGQALGRTGTALRVQLCTEPGLVPPLFATPRCAAAWRALCPAPSVILGFDCEAAEPESEALLACRNASFAGSQKYYYAEPPQIERGWRQHMIDMKGRTYLDMLNNVSVLGHGHPRMVEAVARQWSLLNTNSRFHYAAAAEFSRRLAGLAPGPLDTVFLVNSGTEANDLALRLAWAFSGARDMLCVLEAYHGWSVATDAISTSIADNPRALTTRPDWVHPVTAPNTYRGPFRGEGSTADYVRSVDEALNRLAEAGRRPAGFICEPVYGNAGGIPLPPGYLREVYARVRAQGGVCIADEVQVGYGRLGHYFWGVDQQGVVPDIITVAKAMGNGHPLGAVITRREIADALEAEGYFFSSAGGSPVSCQAGMTVLDVIRDEGLQENARDLGDYFRARLETLVERFPLAGAVHGMGFYLGVEFVRDRETLEPATQETMMLCDRLLELGILMQPTGDHLNVLKIKPPMCLTRESVDYFVDMLVKALAELS